MRTILNNLLQLQAQNVEDTVFLGLAMLYILVLLTTLSSILTRPRGVLFKLAWSLLSLLLPFFGMAVYALYCIWQADHSFLNQLGFTKPKRNTHDQQKQHFVAS